MESELLFAETMKANGRQYDFEVRKTANGHCYLLVRESRQQQNNVVTSGTIIVPMDCLQGFRRAMRVALQFMKSGVRPSSPDTRRLKASDMTDVRRSFPQAYAKWTNEDDDRLKALFIDGWKVSDLAGKFQRKPSAILSRLRKLGVIENP
ncbi:MAG TPA: hypothetical protein PKH24_20695 [Sedimentisphaerales bacterium]|jgi:hypothetical protein|nr:hypothetical protein [Sedimentisphaerales bacterium]HNU31609.1 hypothetical protein [Sedimentisphaerales bacterium]